MDQGIINQGEISEEKINFGVSVAPKKVPK